MIGPSVRRAPTPKRHVTGNINMKFLRIGQVKQLTGLSRMTIYRLELAGEFPKRRQLSKNSVAWLDTDIDRWAESRPAGLRSAASGTSARRTAYKA
jgi:prophage regulatory protein